MNKRRDFIKGVLLGSIGISLMPSCSSSSVFRFKKGQVVGCIGDSITHAGKNGYVEKLQAYFDENYPDLALKFVNLGLSGETITGLTEETHPGPRPFLFSRLDAVLQKTRADIYFFSYGINCGIYQAPNPENDTLYKKGILRFLDAVTKYKAKAILLTPPPLAFISYNSKERDKSLPYTWQQPYPNYDKEVITKFKTIIEQTRHSSVGKIIDIYTPLSNNRSVAYDKDPIHPNKKGHNIIANTILKALDY